MYANLLSLSNYKNKIIKDKKNLSIQYYQRENTFEHYLH